MLYPPFLLKNFPNNRIINVDMLAVGVAIREGIKQGQQRAKYVCACNEYLNVHACVMRVYVYECVSVECVCMYV